MRSPQRSFVCLLLCAVSIALSSCSDEPTPKVVDHKALILNAWGTLLIVPQYEAFEVDATTLRSASEAFCAAPSMAGLVTARDAWRRARTSWKRAELFKFGPHVDFPNRYGSVIDFWPARANTIGDVLNDTALIAGLGQGSAAARGLPVIEFLLFEQGGSSATLELYGDAPNRCAYLLAATQDTQAQSSGIRATWQDTYLDTMLNPQDHPEGMFMDRHEALSEVVNRMAFLLDDIRRDKLGKPAGDQTGSPSPESLESRFSGHALDDIRANLDMIEWVFEGNAALDAPQDTRWLKDHPRFATRQDLLEGFRTALADSRGALNALDAPLSALAVEQPARVVEVIQILGRLQRVIQVDIINALALTRSFNDSDGD